VFRGGEAIGEKRKLRGEAGFRRNQMRARKKGKGDSACPIEDRGLRKGERTKEEERKRQGKPV